MPLPTEVLQLPLWDRLDTAGAERVARMLGQRLPEPWHWVRVQQHEAGGQQRAVAFFDWKGTEFALIPGGQILLGYDPSRPPQVSVEDREDWEQTRGAFGSLEEHLLSTTTPLRQVVLAPYLMEVISRDMEWYGVTDNRSVKITIRQVRDWACAGGFCLPTSDQWEHACRAGTRTVWWWSNSVSFPLPERNAFGLQIAWNTYRWEWCTAPDVYRGGDGGFTCCGGLDGLPTTLRLGSAYFEPFDVPDDSERFFGSCRRVFVLRDD